MFFASTKLFGLSVVKNSEIYTHVHIYIYICMFVCIHTYVHSFILSSMALQNFVGPWPLLQFRNLFTQTVALLGRVISPSQGRYLHTGQHKPMLLMGFEPTIPAFDKAKTVHASDRAATPIGTYVYTRIYV
jgi:hypothetical protein